MSVNLSPVGGAGAQFCDNNGNPLNGGKLYTYSAGTTSPAATYTSAAGSVFHTNPIVLNAGGRVPDSGEIWLSDNISYKFVLKTSADVLIATWDNINGINSNFVNYTVQEEVITATAGQTVFDLSTITYAPATNSLSVYVDGVNQIITEAYVETDANTVTFVSGLHVGAQVKFTTAVPATGTATDAAVVSYEPAGTGAVTTTVQAKLRETVSVKDFGAVGDGVTDDTAAIQAAFEEANNVLLDGTFKTTSPITVTTSNLYIHSLPGSSIVYSGPSGSTWVMQFNDVSTFIMDGQLTIDCDTKAGIGLGVRGASGADLVDISGVTVIDCTLSSPSTSGASGIQVLCNSGTGKVAKITNCVVSNVTRTTGDGTGAACSGIVVNDFDVMVVDNNDVNNILKGNGTVDADGIKIFSQLTGSTYSKCSASVRNNRIRNCEGRWVKTQTRGKCTVENNYFAIDTSLDLLTGFRGVDAQISDNTIQNNSVELLTSWTGGSEMVLFQVQFNSTPDYIGQKIEHKILDNSVFSAAGVPAFSRVAYVSLANLSTNVVTAFAHIEGNVAVGAGGWEGSSIGTIGFSVIPPVGSFASGATANVLINNNRVNTANFMEKFANGANATGANDFTGNLFLTVINNYLPRQRGDIPVLDHSANNSFTSSFCVYGNSVGTTGNRVAMPFDFKYILGGNFFYVGGESTPSRTNAPPSYAFGTVQRAGLYLVTDNTVYSYQALAAIGTTPTWVRYGNTIANTWTIGTYSISRTVPDSSTATTAQLADALNTLVSDLKIAGLSK